MGYPLQLSFRYLTSKKRAFISISTAFAILGVALGVAALATVLSVTGGFQAQFREKVLGVNAHVLVLKYSTDFREYRDVMNRVANVPGVIGVGPFVINPMMVTHGDRTATGVLLKGVDPDLMPKVLDLPRHIQSGSLAGLRRPGALPPGHPESPAPTNLLPPSLVPSSGAVGEPGPTGTLEPEERDDAGRNVTLLRAIEASIKASDAERAQADPLDAGVAKQRASAADERADPAEKPAAVKEEAWARGAPRGSVQPDGGYQSMLPEEDVLPPDLAPDPCTSPDLIAKMPGIVMGTTLAKNLGLGIGDCVEVTSPTIGFTFSQGSIRPPVAKQFRVIATFEAGFDQYDSKLVYTDLYEAQSFYDQGDTVTGVEMKVADIEQARGIAHKIEKDLSGGLYHTMDWEELNHGLFTALWLQRVAMSIVLGLIILVAAFTVIATLIMVVLDKKKEIAVLKTMGATDAAILRAFMYQGGIIGVVGTSVGLALGFAVCKGLLVYAFPLDPKVYFISRLPVEVVLRDFIYTGVIAIVICLLATIIPALYAANLRPADGLRPD